jgi:hypothetical protein
MTIFTAFQPSGYIYGTFQEDPNGRLLRGGRDPRYEQWLRWQWERDKERAAREAGKLDRLRAQRAAATERSRKAREDAAARLRRKQDVVLLELFRQRERSGKRLEKLVRRKPPGEVPTLDELLAA